MSGVVLPLLPAESSSPGSPGDMVGVVVGDQQGVQPAQPAPGRPQRELGPLAAVNEQRAAWYSIQQQVSQRFPSGMKPPVPGRQTDSIQIPPFSADIPIIARRGAVFPSRG